MPSDTYDRVAERNERNFFNFNVLFDKEAAASWVMLIGLPIHGWGNNIRSLEGQILTMMLMVMMMRVICLYMMLLMMRMMMMRLI